MGLRSGGNLQPPSLGPALPPPASGFGKSCSCSLTWFVSRRSVPSASLFSSSVEHAGLFPEGSMCWSVITNNSGKGPFSSGLLAMDRPRVNSFQAWRFLWYCSLLCFLSFSSVSTELLLVKMHVDSLWYLFLLFVYFFIYIEGLTLHLRPDWNSLWSSGWPTTHGHSPASAS